MFHFGRFPSCTYVFSTGFMILHHEGFPIRKSAGRSLFAAHRSLSQLVTSFFGSWCQGIHLTLLFAWTSVKISLYLLGSLHELYEFLLNITFRDSCLQLKKFPFSPFLPPCGEIVFLFPFAFWKDNKFDLCPLLFVFYSNLSSIQLSMISDPLRIGAPSGAGRSGWTRTIDLSVISRVL